MNTLFEIGVSFANLTAFDCGSWRICTTYKSACTHVNTRTHSHTRTASYNCIITILYYIPERIRRLPRHDRVCPAQVTPATRLPLFLLLRTTASKIATIIVITSSTYHSYTEPMGHHLYTALFYDLLGCYFEISFHRRGPKMYIISLD